MKREVIGVNCEVLRDGTVIPRPGFEGAAMRDGPYHGRCRFYYTPGGSKSEPDYVVVRASQGDESAAETAYTLPFAAAFWDVTGVHAHADVSAWLRPPAGEANPLWSVSYEDPPGTFNRDDGVYVRPSDGLTPDEFWVAGLFALSGAPVTIATAWLHRWRGEQIGGIDDAFGANNRSLPDTVLLSVDVWSRNFTAGTDAYVSTHTWTISVADMGLGFPADGIQADWSSALGSDGTDLVIEGEDADHFQFLRNLRWSL